MKKLLFLVLLSGILFSSLIFAVDSYVVVSTNNVPQKQVVSGKWETITEGSTLNPATVLRTGVNGQLVVKLGDKVFTLKAMRQGTLESLISTSTGGSITIGGKETSSNVATSARNTSGTTTASTRAASADELDWAEE